MSLRPSPARSVPARFTLMEAARALREEQLETSRREHERMMRELTAARENQIEANRQDHERETRNSWISRDDRIEQRKSEREQRVDSLTDAPTRPRTILFTTRT